LFLTNSIFWSKASPGQVELQALPQSIAEDS
jgi:hypothetical protein